MGGNSGAKAGLMGNATNALGLESLYNGNAAGENSTLTPELTAEAAHPSGYTPAQMASQTTAAEQTAGGSNAAGAGSALLRAARTRNAGAEGGTIAQVNRQGGENLSQVNAGIQNKNANLQQQQKQQGISGLEGLYGENVGAGEKALGESNTAYKDAGDMSTFWQQLLLQGMQSAGQAATGAI
jgi:hypothetical protein